MKKVYYFIIFFLLALFLVIFYLKNDNYQLKISMNIKNCSAETINSLYSKNLLKQLSTISKNKDIVMIAGDETLNIYIKINPFCLNKKQIMLINESKVRNYASSLANYFNIEFDEKYDVLFDKLLVISAPDTDYYTIHKRSEEIYKKLLNFKSLAKISYVSRSENAIFINYIYDNLLKFNLQTVDLANLFAQSNITSSLTNHKNINSANSKINSIKDIENLVLSYKSPYLQTRFKDVFSIKYDIKKINPIYTKFNSNNCYIIGLKGHLPIFKIKNILKNDEIFDYKILKTKNLSKITVFIDENDKSKFYHQLHQLFLSEKIDNILFFIGTNACKLTNKEKFEEYNDFKITLLFEKKYKNRIEKILKSNSYAYYTPLKNQKITFKSNLEDFLIQDSCADIFDYTYYKFGNDINFDNDMLTKFDISSKEAQNSFIAKQKGIYLGDVFEDDDKMEVYLKNSDVIYDVLSYSKKFKTLFPQKFYSSAKTKPIFNSIATKNGKYFRVEYKYKK